MRLSSSISRLLVVYYSSISRLISRQYSSMIRLLFVDTRLLFVYYSSMFVYYSSIIRLLFVDSRLLVVYYSTSSESRRKVIGSRRTQEDKTHMIKAIINFWWMYQTVCKHLHDYNISFVIYNHEFNVIITIYSCYNHDNAIYTHVLITVPLHVSDSCFTHVFLTFYSRSAHAWACLLKD